MMKLIRKFLCLTLCLLMIASLGTACAGDLVSKPAETTQPGAGQTAALESAAPANEPTEPKVLVMSMTADYATLNPNCGTDSEWVLANIYNQLVAYDSFGNIVPELAKSWETSEDGLSLTFHLEENVYWHDGEKFTSADVKWTLEAIVEYGWYLGTELQVLDSIECPDDYTVVLKLKTPYSPLLGALAYYAAWMMPEHIWAGTDVDTNPANWEPVGTGAFMLESWTPNTEIVLVANENYWRERAKMDEIVFTVIPDANTNWQAFLNGEVQIPEYTPTVAELEMNKDNEDMAVVYYTRNSRIYFCYNFARPATADINVRKAIAMAIDRQQIIDQVLYGVGDAAVGYWVPGVAWAYNGDDTVPEYDPEAAKALLDEAGYKPDANGVRLSLSIIHNGRANYSNICAVLAEQLKVIGIELVQNVSTSYLTIAQGDMDFDLCMLNGTHGPDPSNMASRYCTGGSLHCSGTYSNPALDEVIAQASAKSDQAERGKLYYEAQKILAQDIPIMPIVDQLSWHIYSSKLEGYPIGYEGVNQFNLALIDYID